MGITLKYNPAYENVLGVANDTGQGNLRRQLEEIARRDALDQQRLDESARQFDQGLQAQQYNQVANRGLQWAGLAQNQAQLEQQAYNQQATLEARMAEQQMQNDAYAYGQDAQTQRAYGAEQARMAREAADRRFQKSMKDREVLLDQFNRGMLMPAQKEQAVANWEQQSGMSWGMPDEMAAQEDNQAMQDRVAAIESTFFVNPVTKEPLIEQGKVAKMLELGMAPEKIAAMGISLQSEASKVEGNKAKTQQAELKQQEAVSNMQRDDERAAQTLQHSQEAHKQKMVMDAIKAVQQSKIARAKAIENSMTTEGKGAIPKELTLADLLPPELIPNSGPPSWYLELPVGAEYTAPDGTKRIKGK